MPPSKVKGNGLQPVRAQCVRVQDFKDGAETDVRRSEHEASRCNTRSGPNCTREPHGTTRRKKTVSCPHEYISFQFWIYPLSLFSIVSHSLLWRRAVLGIARTCRVTSHRRCAQGIVHAAAGIIFAENQTLRYSGHPSLPYALRHSPPQTGCGDICSAVHTPRWLPSPT